MRKGVLFAFALLLTFCAASPISACDACVFGLDGHYYCKDPQIYSVYDWPQYAPCRVTSLCDQMYGGGCVEYCSGFACFYV